MLFVHSFHTNLWSVVHAINCFASIVNCSSRSMEIQKMNTRNITLIIGQTDGVELVELLIIRLCQLEEVVDFNSHNLR